MFVSALTKLSEALVYAAFAIVFVSAFIAHTSSGDPASRYLAPVIFLMILTGSYVCYRRLHAVTGQDRILAK